MKIALFIEQDREQIVLTPETDTEKAVLAKLHEDNRIVGIKRGSFYSCRGGWTKQGADDDSTMIVLDVRPEFAEVAHD